jgi:hypothetical protein
MHFDEFEVSQLPPLSEVQWWKVSMSSKMLHTGATKKKGKP